ncbi:hypothetical protein [Alteribacter aurantiacus]|uniref:hypothetical protein n=1 Tax=Alteribacter aurantiacus TaxID=254410 RepID=UPI0006887E57|nr:hypothetical protein [Alteribacter aurantiacus]
MSERRYEYARARCISQLPEPDRSLFRFVENAELSLADEAINENHYVQLLQQQSPIYQAAEAFNLDPVTVFNSVQRIEASLEDAISDYARRLSLIDYTDEFRLQGLCNLNDKVKYFVLMEG